MNVRIFAVFLLLFFFWGSPLWAEPLKFGVNAPRGQSHALFKWKALGFYLSKELQVDVLIVALNVGELLKKASQGQIDFVLANPVQSVVLKNKFKASPIATLNKKSGFQFAGVILTKKGSGIQKIADLHGKKAMSLKFKQAAGGYLFQTYHLMQQGFDPHQDFSSFVETRNQDTMVHLVNHGKIDVAFIRTGILESMHQEKKIDQNNFNIFDETTDGSFSLRRTTELYPEWFVLALAHADETIATQLKMALLKLNENSPASSHADIKGFVNPLPLKSLEEALQKLKMPPF